MAMLSCRHCEAPINSDARLTQCKKCGALFPFVCKACNKQLRPPFPVFEDERYLTLEDDPLCGEHFLRKCPDCQSWFKADENPGFFRCRTCADAVAKKPRSYVPVQADEDDEEDYYEDTPAPMLAGMNLNPNTIILAGAGCAFVVLMFFLMQG